MTYINMPFHAGLEITRDFRVDVKKKTLIFILSAGGLEDTLLQILLGADGFVAKPFGLARLVLCVKRLMR